MLLTTSCLRFCANIFLLIREKLFSGGVLGGNVVSAIRNRMHDKDDKRPKVFQGQNRAAQNLTINYALQKRHRKIPRNRAESLILRLSSARERC